MDTTASLVRALKARTGIDSDYGIAKHLGITRAAVSAYATGRHTLGNDTALRIAAELDLDPGYVLACMAAERAKRPPEKQAWEALAKLAANAAIFLLCVGVTWSFGWDLETVAHAVSFAVGYTHYAQSPEFPVFGVAGVFAVLIVARVCLKSRTPRP